MIQKLKLQIMAHPQVNFLRANFSFRTEVGGHTAKELSEALALSMPHERIHLDG